MYIGTDKNMTTMHRHVRTTGEKLPEKEMNIIREAIKNASKEDLYPNGIIAGYIIKSVVNRYTPSNIETIVTLGEMTNDND